MVREEFKDGTEGQSCSCSAEKIAKCGYIGWAED